VCAAATRLTVSAARVHVVDHPLVQHKLTILRRKETPTAVFRRVLREVGNLMAYEATRDLPLAETRIATPLVECDAPVLAGRAPVVVPVLRAGDGLAQGFLDVLPDASLGHVGLARDHATLAAVEYYFKMPADAHERDAIVVDPMLATGHSAVAAVRRVASSGPRSLRLVCLIAAPEGIAHFHANHPDVPIFTASIDRGLDARGFIVPGLGDAGDRLCGTE
jgi:uracil phosphoribosyltransferase